MVIFLAATGPAYAQEPPSSAVVEPSAPATGPSTPPISPSAPAPGSPGKQADPDPSLEVTAKFHKESYKTGELMKLDLAIKNAGTTEVTGIRAHDGSIGDAARLQYNSSQWGALMNQGVTIGAGQTHQITLSGYQARTDSTVVRLRIPVWGKNGHVVHEPVVTAPITKTTGRVKGIVYGDRNSNSTADPGEELAGATLTLTYLHSGENFETATDTAGRFDFAGVPTAEYVVSGPPARGWRIMFQKITVDESTGDKEQKVRAVLPLQGMLSPSLKFDRDVYRPGETAKIIVALANKGDAPLAGIVAYCNGAGSKDSLAGTGPGWGDLVHTGKGVSIAAGTTKTITVTDTVPREAFDSGRVSVACEFGYAGDPGAENPSARDVARVPGGIGAIVGDVMHRPEGAGKPGYGVGSVRMVLVDKRRCPIVAETVTDSLGHFTFQNVAAGDDYQVYMFAPAGWKLKDSATTAVRVSSGVTSELGIDAVPGTAVHPTLPSQPADCTPPSPGGGNNPPAPPRSNRGLANTGADVLGLLLVGGLAVLLGAGAVIAARRRHPS
jgi:LPXTG-motif cell wall-anchored protein